VCSSFSTNINKEDKMMNGNGKFIMFKKKSLAACVIVLSLLMTLSVGMAFAQEKKGEPIKLGVFMPMTGTMTMYSHPAVAELEIAVKEINDKGGVLGRPFQLIVRDTKMQQEVALREAKSLIYSEGVTFLGGFLSSANALAVSNYVKSLNGKAFLTVYCASSSPITEEQGHRYVSRMGITNTGSIRSLLNDVVKRWSDMKKVFLLNPNYVYGHSSAEMFKQTIAKHIPNAKVVGEVYPPLGTKDFSAYISAAMSSGADVLQTTLYGADAITFLKQAEPYGLLKKMRVCDQDMGLAEATQHFRKGDVGVPIGVLASISFPFYDKKYLAEFPAVAEFTEAVLKKSKYYPGVMLGYAHPYLIKLAMEKAGTTTNLEKIIDALEGMEYRDKGIFKPFIMRACDHQSMVGKYVGILGWDKTGKYPFPIITPETIRYIPPDANLYPSCDEVMAMRKAEEAKRGKK
jgi:branched-chain amino acid transport system substrate-binding protein